ncbi:hypothetical protein TREMEDRAFT_33866 [Tremella mesenterica DSM 1558]|uniref:uncharacterized protein n=1 Tax=Tremella mesenterica (strain ATCC 24925 / CBS 8224 / DSM 1558 / NBRC 9311 / NRRL Y-6157 / RJB 2259-6 / UBC 559-6) TaxID=578456 RepID=UPI0003F49427|nr:uncharacterized protein TREMEDRAFT_33866 [Tremella mesenterica DSM 1558]EIW67214.1 hypothetical protein TREMEDRAFT_33866 [Tremella mesenterica DSM 1558]
MEVADEDFCRRLPKIELHAHLTGSITLPIFQSIWQQRVDTEAGFDLPPPDQVLGNRAGQSVSTFFPLFNTYLYSLISSLPYLLTALKSVLETFQSDNVIYLELRTTPRSLPPHSASEVIIAISQQIQEWNVSQLMWTGLILSIDRSKHSISEAWGILNLALDLRSRGYPVVGLDLGGNPIKGDVKIYREIFKAAKREGLGLTLHFGEIEGRDEEQLEMLSWAPDRLGHVIWVKEEMKRKLVEMDIGVEMCLSCNEDDRQESYEAQYTSHHFGQWWYLPNPISINTDDLGIFHSISSSEHFLACKHFHLSRVDLVRLSRRALKGVFGPTEVVDLVERRLSEFEQEEGIPI